MPSPRLGTAFAAAGSAGAEFRASLREGLRGEEEDEKDGGGAAYASIAALVINAAWRVGSTASGTRPACA